MNFKGAIIWLKMGWKSNENVLRDKIRHKDRGKSAEWWKQRREIQS